MLSQPKSAAIRPTWFLLGLTLVLPTLIATNQHADAISNEAPTYQPSGDWDRYTVRDRDFSVLLPTAPAMSTYDKETAEPLSKINLRNLIGVYSQGVVYSIYIFDRRQSLEEFIAEFARSSNDQFKRDVKVAGTSGKEYGFQDETRKAITQYFITSRYIYVFMANGSTLGNPDVGMPKFFESIRFEPTQTGLAIVDGPGDQAAQDPPSPDASGVLSPKEVTKKAMVVAKPGPTYTEDARQNQVTGTVVLRCVFSASGAVTSIRVISDLPHGLTEKAITAARQIKFIPAIKDGRFVAMHIQLEYNFNLY